MDATPASGVDISISLWPINRALRLCRGRRALESVGEGVEGESS